jgi:hypothetical protein
VTDIVQNGGGGGGQAPASYSHEELIELCALSTSGTLTAEEWSRLGEHLLHCPSCRQRKRQYESVVAHALPVWAASTSRQDLEEVSGSWPLEEAEASLMERLDAEHPPTTQLHATPSPGLERKSLHIYLLAALVLFCCGAALYTVQFHRRKTLKAPPPIETSPAQIVQTNPTVRSLAHAPDDTKKYEEEIARLRAQLEIQRREIDRLDADRLQLEQDLSVKAGDLTTSAQQNVVLERQLASAHADLAALEDKLSLAEQQGTENANQIAALQSETASLNFALKQGDRELAEDEELLSRDRDIRDLIGARNLYIAEIYDVAKSGATQKPFGRVFYTKDKSLIFYGYDLDQQPGIKDTSTFQAWGRSGSSERDVSLGLFYQDDANKKRWILKCNDPRTLARLDAVFITVEPKGGSAKPTGKPILFTYLRLEPNHP